MKKTAGNTCVGGKFIITVRSTNPNYWLDTNRLLKAENENMAHRLTADKRGNKDFPKLPSCLRANTHRQAATSFIRKPLWAILTGNQPQR